MKTTSKDEYLLKALEWVESNFYAESGIDDSPIFPTNEDGYYIRDKSGKIAVSAHVAQAIQNGDNWYDADIFDSCSPEGERAQAAWAGIIVAWDLING